MLYKSLNSGSADPRKKADVSQALHSEMVGTYGDPNQPSEHFQVELMRFILEP